jgi:hypothetical protein
VVSRRRFLFLVGSAGPGLWLAGAGLLQLQRRFVLALGGACSFCGKSGKEVNALAGITGRSVRICNECIQLCFEILGESIVVEDADARRSPPAQAPPEPVSPDDDLRELLSSLESQTLDPEVVLAEVRRRLDGDRLPGSAQFGLGDFRCSFCDARRRDVRKLISGPRVFICESCVGDAAGLTSQVVAV